jgi:hypothetical protein
LCGARWWRRRFRRAPTPLSLDEAIEQALAHNRDLAKGALDVRGYRLAQQEARESVRGFRVVPEGAAGMGPDGEDWRSGLRAEATGPAGTRVALAAAIRSVEVDEADEMRRGEVRVEISQPLFRDFGSLVRNEPAVAAGETLRAARRAWERDRSALVLRVVELYEGLIYRRRQIERDEELAGRLERLWALADARERQGRATRTEVMRLDFQRGEAEARLETAGRGWRSNSRSSPTCWGCRWIRRSVWTLRRCWTWIWPTPAGPWPWRWPNGRITPRRFRRSKPATASCGWRADVSCRICGCPPGRLPMARGRNGAMPAVWTRRTGLSDWSPTWT